MTTQILNFSFNKAVVSFRNDGYLNATEIAQSFGKATKDYLKTERTQEYIAALIEFLSDGKKILSQSDLVIVKKGNSKNFTQGTWLHPKLAIDFARWLNPKFAVWCDFQIEKILGINQDQVADRLPKTTKALPNGLTIEQQEEIKKFQRELCAAVPKEKQRNLSIALWSAVKAKFGVGYKEVAPEHYLEVMSLMARVAVEKGVLYGEVLDKEQPKGILMSEEQVYQLSTLTRYAQRMSLDFEHIAPALDRLDSKLAGRAYSWGVEPNHWICCIQRFLMQATKQMTNPKYIEGVRDNFVHMM